MNEVSITKYISCDITPWLSRTCFEIGKTIFEEGFHAQKLYHLIQGCVKVYKLQKNGKVSLIELLNAPALIGEMELLGIRNETLSVVALTPCVCEVIDAESCRAMLVNDPVFLRFLCSYLGQKAVSHADRYAVSAAYPLSVRLAGFILLTRHGAMYREKHTEVSEYLGVTYRHLLYVLADFVKKGFLKKTPQGYEITDMNALQKLAAQNENRLS